MAVMKVVEEEEGVGFMDKTDSNQHRPLKTKPLLEVENTPVFHLKADTN